MNYLKNINRERIRQSKIRKDEPCLKKMYNARYRFKRKQYAVRQHVNKFTLVQSFKKVCKLKKSTEYYIWRIASKLRGTLIKRRLESESIYKWFTVAKNSCLNNMKKVLSVLKEKSHVSLTRANECINLKSNKHEITEALCGFSSHNTSSEPYYYESSYVFEKKITSENNPLIMNKEGQVTNILPLISKQHETTAASWHCNQFCVIRDETIQKYKKLLEVCQTITLKKAVNAKFISQLRKCSNNSSSNLR